MNKILLSFIFHFVIRFFAYFFEKKFTQRRPSNAAADDSNELLLVADRLVRFAANLFIYLFIICYFFLKKRKKTSKLNSLAVCVRMIKMRSLVQLYDRDILDVAQSTRAPGMCVCVYVYMCM